MTNKQNIYERLIDGLADKELRLGCIIANEWGGLFMYIGDDSKYFGCIRAVSVAPSETMPAGTVYDLEHPDSYQDETNNMWAKLIGHPIMLPTILVKMKDCTEQQKEKLRQLWEACNIEASLQSLYESTSLVFADCKSNCPEPWCEDCIGRLQDPNIEALFRYIESLNII